MVDSKYICYTRVIMFTLIRQLLTIIIVLLSIIYLAIQTFMLPNYQNMEINAIIDRLDAELHNVEPQSLIATSIDQGAFVCLFAKTARGEMTPVVYNKSFFSGGYADPVNVYKSYANQFDFMKLALMIARMLYGINKFNPYTDY